MSALTHLTRSWPVFSALGAGLVLTAVGAGAMGAPAWGIAAAAALIGSGIAALGWAVVALRTGRAPAPRAALVAALVLIAASAAVFASGAAAVAGIASLPLLVADLFALVVAVGAAVTLRTERSARAGRADAAGVPRTTKTAMRSARRPVVSAIGVAAGAALVAALATPALAGTRAGEEAVPHGEHGTSLTVPGRPGHHH
ncbi:hypothetical protein [Agromyces aureus]|uniref:Uncharacterized protein n=1 Tax=Agromyces aureus TaxID=453304 RepID=A0A191WIW7_9MICO|nr:hypothetical protein [Agromyces aureus]ANJ28201.1 hypothetical protein ATC03_17320 [Agromyces aureus]